jgi:hypothetical protein
MRRAGPKLILLNKKSPSKLQARRSEGEPSFIAFSQYLQVYLKQVSHPSFLLTLYQERRGAPSLHEREPEIDFNRMLYICTFQKTS